MKSSQAIIQGVKRSDSMRACDRKLILECADDPIFVRAEGWDPVTGASLNSLRRRKLTRCAGVGTLNLGKLIPLFLNMP